jgi:hypothetical protein
MALRGTDKLLKNLNKQIKKIEGRNEAGMRQACLLVRRRAQKKTPVDTGNLRNSAYTDVEGQGDNTVGRIGYTAFYAPYVHEIDKNYRAPGTSWKFLELAIKESTRDIIDIIKNRAGTK